MNQDNTLAANRKYICSVSFGRTANTPEDDRVSFSKNTGIFTTAPANGHINTSLSFLLGSCNLHSLGFISSPDKKYKTISGLIDSKSPSFMLHCGDQIYSDIPFKSDSIKDYRDKYLDAWEDSDPTREVLTKLPHYMILDDHEIVNNFSNDPDENKYRKSVALKAYREFVHIRNPQSYGTAPLYYTFNWGNVHFFVLDVRTERYMDEPDNQIIGDEQMEVLKEWLIKYSTDQKFIVSSVPFVGQVRGSKDKWCSNPYKHQREEIIDFIAKENIDRIVFLTGDMHNSYHPEMEIKKSNGKKIVIHELMSSPINQLSKSSTSSYKMNYSSKTAEGTGYTSTIGQDSFYNKHSNIMAISLINDQNVSQITFEIFRTSKKKPPEITGTFNF